MYVDEVVYALGSNAVRLERIISTNRLYDKQAAKLDNHKLLKICCLANDNEQFAIVNEVCLQWDRGCYAAAKQPMNYFDLRYIQR